MVEFVWGIIKALRPRQWVKNFALFAPLVFSGLLFDPLSQLKAIEGFFLFCGFSSATYLLNDVFDINRDMLHPFKKKRPIASGLVPPVVAVGISFGIIIILMPVALSLSFGFFVASVAYLILQLCYSAYLKQLILIDVMVIAAGFLLRIYAGAWAIDAHLNIWFLLSVASFAMFIAIGKRRSELTLMEGAAAKHRETLLHYPQALLDIMTAMFANSTWLTYALFAFLQPPIIARNSIVNIFNDISVYFSEAKYLMITIPVVVYGVMRYLYIIYEKKEGESPERVLLSDKPMLATVSIWLILLVGIIYFLGA